MIVRNPELQAYRRRCHLAGALTVTALLTLLLTLADGRLDELHRQTENEVYHRQTLIAQSTDLAQRTDVLLAELDQSQKELQQSQRRIPEVPGEHQFTELLHRLAEDAGMTIDELRPEQIYHSRDMDRITLRMRAESSWTGLCSFLNAVISMERLCHVDQCSVNAVEGTPERLRMELQVSIFCRAPVPVAKVERQRQ